MERENFNFFKLILLNLKFGNFKVEKPGKHYLNQIIKVNFVCDAMWLSCTSWYEGVRRALHLYGPLLQKP